MEFAKLRGGARKVIRAGSFPRVRTGWEWCGAITAESDPNRTVIAIWTSPDGEHSLSLARRMPFALGGGN
jgi:hypothetical protein